MSKKITHEIDEYIGNINFDFLSNKTILITGASGLIGSYMIDVLFRSNILYGTNIKIYAAVRNLKNAEKRFSHLLGDTNFTIVVQDLEKNLDFNFETDYIIHAASNANPKAFDEDPIGTIKSNVNGTMNLLDYAKNNKTKKLLYISSTEVYGENISEIQEFSETDMGIVNQMLPRSCYTESKRMAENICVNYSKQYKVSTNIVRVGYGYGPSFTDNDNRVIPQFIRNAVSGENILMKSNGNLIRSYVYVFDIISGIIKVLDKGEEADVYNIANKNSNVSIRDIAETVARHSNLKVDYDLSEQEKSQGYAPFSMGLINASKLEKLGWKPLFDLEKGIHSVVDFKVENILSEIK